MNEVAEFWGTGDVAGRVIAALEKAGKPLDRLTPEDLAPVDQYHARGLAATVELADRLAVRPDDSLLDIGCGIGGPARYMAARFGCRVSGVDITQPFIVAAEQLTALLGMSDRVRFTAGDGRTLPYPDASFDGATALHVTMNVEDRAGFFAEAFRVLKPGGFLAVTEHGQGPAGAPHVPVPWSADGRFSYLRTPEETETLLRAAGFVEIELEETGAKYLAGYRQAIAAAERGEVPVLGLHVLMGADAGAKTRNAARNIEEGRTRPVLVICRKPG